MKVGNIRLIKGMKVESISQLILVLVLVCPVRNHQSRLSLLIRKQKIIEIQEIFLDRRFRVSPIRLKNNQLMKVQRLLIKCNLGMLFLHKINLVMICLCLRRYLNFILAIIIIFLKVISKNSLKKSNQFSLNL